MGKSLGNALEVRHLLERTRPLVLRYYLTAAHYRSMIEYHPGSLEEAGAAVERIEGFLERAAPTGAGPRDRCCRQSCPRTFVESMDDDLGVSGALAVVHETVRAGNTRARRGRRRGGPRRGGRCRRDDRDPRRESACRTLGLA